MSFTINFTGGPAGLDNRARTDGVSGAQVTITATVSGSTYLVRIVNTTDPSPPTPVQDAVDPRIWRFTPVNGAHTYTIELIVDLGLAGETRTRRIYAIREQNSGLRYPAPMEKANPDASLFNAGTAIIEDSEDNEDDSVFGWDPDMRAWLVALNQFYRVLEIPQAVLAADAWILRHNGNNYLTVDTRASAERVTFGSGTNNPQFTFAGNGNVLVGGYVRAPNLVLPELPGDPGTSGNQGTIYTKDVGGNEELFFQDDGRVIQLTSGSGVNVGVSGEANTGSNLGVGEEVFAQKVGVDLQFRTLLGGTGITLTTSSTDITIDRNDLELNDLTNVSTGIAAQGDVLYYNGSGWVNLAAGTSGQFLQTQGAGANPIWANPAAAPISAIANIGTGEGLFAQINSSTAEFKSIVAGSNITLSSTGSEVTISAASAGEANTASNVGTGSEIFASKVGVDLRFRTLIGGTGITITQNANDLTLTSAAALSELTDVNLTGVAQGDILYRNGTQWVNLAAGSSGQVLTTSGPGANPSWTSLPTSVTAGANLGAGEGVFAQANGSTLEFKSLVAGTNVTLSSTGTTVTINATATGEANTASNLGTGEGLFTTKSGVNLPFKSLVGGTGITLSSTASEVTIDRDPIALGGLSDVSLTSPAQGDILYRNASGWVNLSSGTSGQVLTSGGTGANPSWTTISGFVTDGSNLGTGEGVFAQLNGSLLEYKSLVGGTGVSITSTATEITIDASGATTLQGAYNGGRTVTTSAGPIELTASSASASALDIVSGRISMPNTILIGNATTGTGINSVVIGDGAQGGAVINAVTIGDGAISDLAGAGGTNFSVTIGAGALNYGFQNVCIGGSAQIGGGASPQPNSVAIGFNSTVTNSGGVAIGNNSSAARAVAIGLGVTANFAQSIAIGDSPDANGTNAIAIGRNTLAGAGSATALGDAAQAQGLRSVAVGVNAVAVTPDSVSVGNNASSGSGASDEAVAVGANSGASGDRSVALGFAADSSGAGSVSLGSSTSTGAANAVAVGGTAIANAAGTVALGSGANAGTNLRSIAIGQNATTTAAQQLVIGGDTFGVTEAIIGYGPASTSPPLGGLTLRTTDGSGTNTAGAPLVIRPGLGTGSASSGALIFQTATGGASGSTLNTPLDRLTIAESGAFIVGSDAGLNRARLVSNGSGSPPEWWQPVYGSLSVLGNGVVTPITTTSVFETVNVFTASGTAQNATASTANGTIEVDQDGVYEIKFTGTVDLDALFSMQFFVIGASALGGGIQVDGTGVGITGVALHCIETLNRTDQIVVQIANDTTTADALVQDGYFSVRRID